MSFQNWKYICKECNFVSKGYHRTCPNCHEGPMVTVGYKARPPRKNASKRKWKAFWKRFPGWTGIEAIKRFH